MLKVGQNTTLMARFERNTKKKQKYHEVMISHFNNVTWRMKLSVDTEGRRIAAEQFIIQGTRFSALLSPALRPYQVHRTE